MMIPLLKSPKQREKRRKKADKQFQDLVSGIVRKADRIADGVKRKTI